jgi:hypothetical protein
MDRADKLDMLIRRWGGTQTEAAQAARIVPTRLSEWKRKAWPMPIEAGVRLARVLGVSVEFLVDEDMEALPAPEISQDEREVIGLYRALGLAKDEALRLLASGAAPWSGMAQPVRIVAKHDEESRSEVQAKRQDKRAKRKGGESGPPAGGATTPRPGGAPDDSGVDQPAVPGPVED